MGRALVYVVPIALAIFALFDLARSLPEERAGLRRSIWVLIIVFLPAIGPITWIAVSRTTRAPTRPSRPGRPGPAQGRGPLRPPTRRPGPVAPDDDPEFLWRLEQQRRRAAGEPPLDEPNPPA